MRMESMACTSSICNTALHHQPGFGFGHAKLMRKLESYKERRSSVTRINGSASDSVLLAFDGRFLSINIEIVGLRLLFLTLSTTALNLYWIRLKARQASKAEHSEAKKQLTSPRKI